VDPTLDDFGKSKGNDFELIKKALSVERFESHRKHSNEPDEIVFARYQWNAMICGHFYGILSILEVTLRNSFDQAIATKTGDANWLTKVPAWLRESEQGDVRKAHDFLKDRNRNITQARVVQEMSFGFWTSLLNGRYETLFHGIGAKVFPGLPRAQRTRGNASQRFESIRTLRNRIFHYRRIWNRADLRTDYDHILEAIDWVNPEARRLFIPEGSKAQFTDAFSKRP
jgi:hypothetical protein